jgi:hypothetical protein
MKPRVASLLLAFVFISVPVFAQNLSSKGGTKDLSADLAALAARVSKLEGNIVASDLAGTYNLMVVDTSMTGAHAPQPATITTSAGRATLRLNANGTGSVSGLACEGSTLALGIGALTDAGADCGGAEDVTWTYADGVITTTTNDGEQIPYSVALGGRLLIVAGAPFHPSDPSSDSLLFIATRLQ